MPETSEALDVIDGAINRLMSALEQIAAEHGPDAVELAMTAYQVDAIGYLAASVVAASMLGIVPYLYRHLEASFKRDDPAVGIPAMMGMIACGAAGLVGAFNLITPARWLAAFGSPEILMATNILKSAGLM